MQLRCVIVDDDKAFLNVAQALLERNGVIVAGTAGSSAEAVQRVRALQPDVVLIDIRLGQESGFDAARQLAGNGHSAALVMISTHTAVDYADLIAESPAAGFLPKAELSAAALRRILGASLPSRAASAAHARRIQTESASGSLPGASVGIPLGLRCA